MFHGPSDVSGIDVTSVNIINYLFYIDWRFIGWSFDDIWHILEVGVILRVDKRYAPCGIFTVFQCFYLSYAAPVATKTAYGKHALVEHLVELIAKKFSVIYDIFLYAIFSCHLLDRKITITCGSTIVFPTDNMKIHLSAIRIAFVILSKARNKSVETMPIMNFRYGNKMNVLLLLRIMKRNAVQVDTIAYADGAFAEDGFLV